MQNNIPTLSLTFSSGETIETTSEHSLYLEGQGFVPAGRLSIGNAIVTRAGPAVKVVKVERHESGKTVYNFTVAGDHTYFVGKQSGGVWVHNIFCSPDPLVAEIAKEIERLYPGHVLGVNQTLGGHEVDIILRNAIIEVKSGGSGLTKQVLDRLHLGVPVIAYSPKLGKYATRAINAAGGIATHSLEELLRVIHP